MQHPTPTGLCPATGSQRRWAIEPIYNATGEPTERFSAEDLAADIQARGTTAEVFDDIDAAAVVQGQRAQDGDVILVMSNGAFGNIWEKILAALSAG